MDKIKIHRGLFMFDIKFNITFVTFFKEKCSFEYDVEKYDENVAFCLKSGSFSYGYSAEKPNEYTANPGSIVLCKSGEALYRYASGPISICMIKFKSNSDIFKSGEPIAVRDFSRFEYNLKTLESIHFITEPAVGLSTEHYCRDIIYQVIDSISEAIKPLGKSYLYIKNNFTEPISVKELAKSENFSTVHFINTFKEEYGKAPKEYITELRMRKASYMLKNSCFNITEIADMCGYEDPLYFSRHFKAYYGISPKNFRQ